MSFSTAFTSFEHGIAKTAKYIATGLGDVISFANKAQPYAPEVALLAQAVAGPLGSQLSDMGFNLLGEVAGAVKNTQADASSASQTVTLTLTTTLINDIKSASATIEAAVKAVGGELPAKK